jgi:hypothetical protein
LSVQFNTDNDSVSVAINGTPVPFVPSSQPNNIGSTTVSNPALFLTGDNVLSLGVFNWEGSLQPSGLNLVGSVEFVPEPSSFAIAALGVVALFGLGWRRRN